MPAGRFVAVLVILLFGRWHVFNVESYHVVVLARPCPHLLLVASPLLLQLHLEQLLLRHLLVVLRLQHLHHEYLGEQLLDPDVSVLLLGGRVEHVDASHLHPFLIHVKHHQTDFAVPPGGLLSKKINA